MLKKLIIFAILLLVSVNGFAQNPDSIPFAQPVNYSAGDGTYGVFCADLDGDTDLDLVVTNIYDDNISVFKNNGNGTFQSAVNYSAGDGPRHVFCADLDGDLDLDLVTANDYSDNISILRNNGDGTFQAKTDYPAGDHPYCVFCADFNGDSHIDIAVANLGTDNISIFMNNGDGTFQPKADYPAGDGPIWIYCADLDGDTDPDLAVANYLSNNVSILKNNGNGTFQSPVNYGAGSAPWSIFCADLDGDSDFDLAVGNFDGDNVSILKNNGDGTFQNAVNYAAGDGPYGVFCADLDGDADLDITMGNHWSGKVSILKNTGYATFQPPIYYTVGTVPGPRSVYCADLDGDLDLDLAVANENGYVSVLKNLRNEGTIAGTVKDASTQQNLQGVLVEALQGAQVKGSANTDQNGNYSIPNLSAGSYDVRASKSGYETQTQTGKNVVAGQTTTVDFQLTPLPTGDISGFVYDGCTNSGLGGVLVEFLQDQVVRYSTTTQAPSGLYELSGVIAGSYDVRYSKTGYITLTLQRTIDPGWNLLNTVTLIPVGYVSSQPLKEAIENLNTALSNYLEYNSLLAWDANSRAYQKIRELGTSDISKYWTEILEGFILHASHEVNVRILEKLIDEEFSASKDGLLLFVENVVFQLQKLDINLMLSELLSKAKTGDPLSLSYFRNVAVIDANELTVQNAIDGLTIPTLPGCLPSSFPRDKVIDHINSVTEDLEAVSFCCPATVNGKFERTGIWWLPGQCNLSKAQNYTLGTDIQQAMRYYVALDKMVDADKWEGVHQAMCSGSAPTLAYAAKFASLIVGGALIATPAGLGILGGCEALYTAYGASCTGIGYNALSVKYNKTTKLAHSLLEYNSSWPDALMYALELRNKIVDDIVDAVNSPSGVSCSKDWEIVSTDVPDYVCADFLTQFVDFDAKITVENKNLTYSGPAKLITTLYAVGKNGILSHIRTDSSQTVIINPNSAHQFTMPLRVIANALFFENDRYKLVFQVITSGEIYTASESFQCLYDYQCDIQEFTDKSKKVFSGFIRKGSSSVSSFVSGAGAKLTEFTLSWPGSDLNLHVYDAIGNHVGCNDSTGLIEIEIPGATYSGPNSYPEIITIPNASGNYNVRVEGIEALDSTYFYVEAYEIFQHVPVLLPVVPSLDLVGQPGDSIDFSLGLQEAGRQAAAEGITASINSLVSDSGDTISHVYLSLPFNSIPPDTFYYAHGYVKTNTLNQVGNYIGVINVSFNGGSFQIPVFLSLIRHYTCGNVNSDSSVSVSDVVYLINYLFKSGQAPHCAPYIDCADVNWDGKVSVSDVVYLINYLFKGGPVPCA